MSQPRESTYRVKVQTIVSPCPGSTDLLILLEDNRVDSSTPERARGGEARGPCADNDYREFWQRGFLSRKSV
jgi:hypothetical protein